MLTVTEIVERILAAEDGYAIMTSKYIGFDHEISSVEYRDHRSKCDRIKVCNSIVGYLVRPDYTVRKCLSVISDFGGDDDFENLDPEFKVGFLYEIDHSECRRFFDYKFPFIHKLPDSIPIAKRSWSDSECVPFNPGDATTPRFSLVKT